MSVKVVDTRRAVKAAYFNERAEYKSMAGVNKFCTQSLKGCKQSTRVSVIYCPFFKAIYKGPIRPKEAAYRLSTTSLIRGL